MSFYCKFFVCICLLYFVILNVIDCGKIVYEVLYYGCLYDVVFLVLKKMVDFV